MFGRKRKRNHYELIEPRKARRVAKKRPDDDELITVTTGTTRHSGHYHGTHQQISHTTHHGFHNHPMHQLEPDRRFAHNRGNLTMDGRGFGASGVGHFSPPQHSTTITHGTHQGTIHGTANTVSVSRTMTKGEYRAMVRRQWIGTLIVLSLIGAGAFLWSQGYLAQFDFLPPPQ